MERIDHYQINVAKPLVGANSNWQDQTNGEILGRNGNIGSLANRKVRVTTEDGTEMVILKNEDFMMSYLI